MAKAALVLFALVLMRVLPAAGPSLDGTLKSFYIASASTFGIWSDNIVSVEPVGQDTRIRAMRVVSVNEVCPDIRVVQAAERFERGSTVQSVSRLPICDISQQRIDRAAARSKTPDASTAYVDYMGVVLTVVADCVGRPRVLNLRDGPPWLDFDTMRRLDPVVAGLWDLRYNLSKGMLPTSAQVPAPAVESLGVTLLPELRSPKYATVFGNDLVKALEDYTAPPTQREPVPVVLERDALSLVTFVPPRYPPIAMSARMFGDVRLRLTVDGASGSVRNVEQVSGEAILGDAAIAAVRAWKFDTARALPQPVAVTVRFELDCRQH